MVCPEVFLVYITDCSGWSRPTQYWWWRLLGSLPTGTPDSRLEPGQSNVSLTTPGPGFLCCLNTTSPSTETPQPGLDWTRHGTQQLGTVSLEILNITTTREHNFYIQIIWLSYKNLGSSNLHNSQIKCRSLSCYL